MKLLADMGVGTTTLQALRAAGHDTVHLRDEGLQCLADAAILGKARDEGRVVITFDLDFGDLLAAGGATAPSVVIVRSTIQTPHVVTPQLLEALRLCGAELDAGAIVIVEDTRCRIRRLPVRP